MRISIQNRKSWSRFAYFLYDDNYKYIGGCRNGYRHIDRYRTDGDYDMLLYGVWIEPEYRRQGFGRRLIMLALNHARQLKFDRLLLDVEIGNEIAKHLYKSLGFYEIDADDEVIYMVKDFTV